MVSKRRVSCQQPADHPRTRTIGITTSKRRRDAEGVMRPLGKGRCGLLIASSATAEGARWFDTSKIRRLDQVIKKARGIRERIGRMVGEGLLVNRGPERDAKRAKSVVGRRKVGMSFAVKR